MLIQQNLVWIIAFLSAFIPGPVLFGYLLDISCLVRTESICDDFTGACQFYDNDAFRLSIHGVTLLLHVIGLILTIAIWCIIRNKKLDDVDDAQSQDVRGNENGIQVHENTNT